ncbi:hypothetical protein NDU88_004489 [Pleurodeles waltl]|uniref:Uncharacterized protein n=1 Tax=Pleurodeles waltl TaxID=8319 RepID=A0AAV7TS25_PLEWA|nr:hypothetical protein NDU88_004489 [Pleurodeles waltl]
MWEGGREPTAGRNPCSGPRRVLIFALPRPGDRVQASPNTTEAQAEYKRHLSQVSTRGGPGTLSPFLFWVQRCSGPRSAEQSAAPLAALAPGPGRPGRTRSGRGAEGARATLGKAAHSSPGNRRTLEPQRRLVGSLWLRSAHPSGRTVAPRSWGLAHALLHAPILGRTDATGCGVCWASPRC